MNPDTWKAHLDLYKHGIEEALRRISRLGVTLHPSIVASVLNPTGYTCNACNTACTYFVEYNAHACAVCNEWLNNRPSSPPRPF